MWFNDKRVWAHLGLCKLSEDSSIELGLHV